MQNRASAEFKEIAGAVLKEGASLSFRAGGRSMTPFIRDNETVIIEPLLRSLRIGDIILFRSQDRRLILHRIVQKRGGSYVTKGDSVLHDDGTVAHDDVLGRAVHIVGGLNFHIRFPLSMLMVYALRLRHHSRIFNLLRVPGRFLLGRRQPLEISGSDEDRLT